MNNDLKNTNNDKKKKCCNEKINDNIDKNNMIFIWISLSLKMKWNIFPEGMHERNQYNGIFDTRLYFWPFFWAWEG